MPVHHGDEGCVETVSLSIEAYDEFLQLLQTRNQRMRRTATLLCATASRRNDAPPADTPEAPRPFLPEVAR
jgi:hypothetical protein